MAIFDCFQYFNEEHIAELRFNILNKFVDKFIVVESTVNHQGQSKKLNFDINKYKKFKIMTSFINLITISRILLAPIILFLLIDQNYLRSYMPQYMVFASYLI